MSRSFLTETGLPCFGGKEWCMCMHSLPGSFPSPKRASMGTWPVCINMKVNMAKNWHTLLNFSPFSLASYGWTISWSTSLPPKQLLPSLSCFASHFLRLLVTVLEHPWYTSSDTLKYHVEVLCRASSLRSEVHVQLSDKWGGVSYAN